MPRDIVANEKDKKGVRGAVGGLLFFFLLFAPVTSATQNPTFAGNVVNNRKKKASLEPKGISVICGNGRSARKGQKTKK